MFAFYPVEERAEVLYLVMSCWLAVVLAILLDTWTFFTDEFYLGQLIKTLAAVLSLDLF
jgi:hypothetical protein